MTGVSLLLIPSMPFVIAGASIGVGYVCIIGVYNVIKFFSRNKTK
jgi:hypothetical protein